jgi:4-hydroxy-2-oxoheptanedioate aldolase
MKQRSAEPSLRQRLLGGETLYGLVIKPPAPALVEMCAAAGFDFAFIDGEHGSGETLEWEHHVRAAESFGMPAVIRVGSHQPAEILGALDIGAVGIIVPHVNTKLEAEAIVRADAVWRQRRARDDTRFPISKSIFALQKKTHL